MTVGTVLEIFVTPSMGQPMERCTEVRAIAGRGLEGDRYAAGIGFYSNTPTTAGARELTLIDHDAIIDIEAQTGIPFSTIECRRNLITREIDLNGLLGTAFSIGEVRCEGVRGCPPCVHLEELTDKKVMKALVRTGGLRARIVHGGIIRVGDTIEVIGPALGASVGNNA